MLECDFKFYFLIPPKNTFTVKVKIETIHRIVLDTLFSNCRRLRRVNKLITGKPTSHGRRFDFVCVCVCMDGIHNLFQSFWGVLYTTIYKSVMVLSVSTKTLYMIDLQHFSHVCNHLSLVYRKHFVNCCPNLMTVGYKNR